MSPEDELAWKEMWERKDDGREMFATAELTVTKELKRWRGHGAKPEYAPYWVKAGDRVLITMVSRFGHAGIRGTSIDKEEHGYDACVPPEQLKNLKFLSDGGRPWRKEMEQKWGTWDTPEEDLDDDPLPELCAGSTQFPCMAKPESRKTRRWKAKSKNVVSVEPGGHYEVRGNVQLDERPQGEIETHAREAGVEADVAAVDLGPEAIVGDHDIADPEAVQRAGGTPEGD